MAAITLMVSGPDRAGLVKMVADVIERHQGNWLESRMAQLSGQFAGIIRATLPESAIAGLEADCKRLSQTGLSIHVDRQDEAAQAPSPGREIRIEAVGPDHPGIVHEVAQFLADRDINIVELSSWCESGAMSGGQVFHAEIAATVPAETALRDVEEHLSGLAEKLMVDIQLDDLEGSKVRI